MSTDHSGLHVRVRTLEEQLAELGQLAREHDRSLIDLAGVSGRNGKVGEMRRDVDEIKQSLTEQRKLLVKAILLSATGAIGGGGVTAGILKLLGS